MCVIGLKLGQTHKCTPLWVSAYITCHGWCIITKCTDSVIMLWKRPPIVNTVHKEDLPTLPYWLATGFYVVYIKTDKSSFVAIVQKLVTKSK